MSDLSPRALWNEDALRALIAWGKTFHYPWQPDVEWNIWQLALALEAHLGESPAFTPTEEDETC
jgi:hypothetical protein